jgi:hypothetical protein
MNPRAGELPLLRPLILGESQSEVAVAMRIRKIDNRFLGTHAAAEYSGIPAGTLRAWRCQGVGPRFYKPRGRALYDIADLDEFIRSGIRVASVRASREERNVYLPTG